MSLKNLNVKNKIHKLLKKFENKRINQIYKEFEKSVNLTDKFAVAVSGGPDSMALAFLSKLYSIKNKVPSKFFIVDHKLRSESTNEAKKVKQILNKYAINAKILTWKGKKPTKNIQSLARDKRYQLLIKCCDKFKINNILLGHHQDDLVENFFIRMIRGSGLKGLTSLDKENKISNKNLLRPLLGNKKEDLRFVSRHVFNFYVQDPSNIETKYQRTKIRVLIKELEKNGLDKKKLIKTIDNLKYSNSTVRFYVNENIKKNTFYSVKKNQFILSQEFFKEPYEVIFRALSNCINLVGKKYYSARGKKIDKIIGDIRNYQLSKVTLGGCIIEKVNQTVIISKEH